MAMPSRATRRQSSMVSISRRKGWLKVRRIIRAVISLARVGSSVSRSGLSCTIRVSGVSQASITGRIAGLAEKPPSQ